MVEMSRPGAKRADDEERKGDQQGDPVAAHRQPEQHHRGQDDQRRRRHRDQEVRNRLADHERERVDRCHAYLLHRAGFLLADDRERGRSDGRDHRDVSDEPRNEKQRAAKLGVVPDARLDGDWRTDGDPLSRELRANGPQDVRRVTDDGRGRVRVVAADDHLDRPRAARFQVAAEALIDNEHGPGLIEIQHPLGVPMSEDRRCKVEVPGVDEGGDDAATLWRTVTVLDDELDVADVEVQRVAVQQQEERRHEDEDRQRAPIAIDLAKFLPVNGERLGHAAVPPAFSTTSRKTSSSEGSTSVAESTFRPAAESRPTMTSGAIDR